MIIFQTFKKNEIVLKKTNKEVKQNYTANIN